MPANDWHDFFLKECRKPYFNVLNKAVGREYRSGVVYPPQEFVFRAFELTPYEKTKVVILGQDPYHEPGQAMGMSFSVPVDCRIPPSLVNIYKEIHDELKLPIPNHGDLSYWAKQGVLLLNTTLTVRRGIAYSHKNLGWDTFTDEVISYIDKKAEPVVFLLWGRPAQQKAKLLKNTKHLVLMCAHPSPLSASRGFFGCGHFLKANLFLEENGMEPVDWSVPDIERSVS